MNYSKKLVGICVLFTLLMIGCVRGTGTRSQSEADAAIPENPAVIEIVENDKNLPAVRYVNARNGLNRRDSPSVSGTRLGTLLHGARIIAWERSENPDTIDGITAYWYLCQGGVSGGGGGDYWVFGGFLSRTLPEDVVPILGRWYTDRGSRYFWHFRPDYTASSGIREAGSGWMGHWVLYENNLSIETFPIIPTDDVWPETETLEIILDVINRDKIILHFSDGAVEVLTRSNDIV